MGVITEGAQMLSAAANDMPRRESWWACEDGCWKYYDTRSPHVYNRADLDYDHNSRWFFFQHQKMVKRALEGNKVILKWHVKRVSPGALIAAVIYLDERAPRGKSVRLEFDFGGWHYLEVRTPAEAIELIPRIQALRSTEPLLATQIQEQPFDLLEESPAVIREGLRAWQRSGGSMAARSTTILMPRALVFGWCDAQDELVFDHIGPLSLFADPGCQHAGNHLALLPSSALTLPRPKGRTTVGVPVRGQRRGQSSRAYRQR